MGTLGGHIIPGTFFILFSVWWIINIFNRYFSLKRRAGMYNYRNSCTFPCPCYPRIPVEGIFKIVAVTVGITGETVTGFKNGRWVHMMNAEHITMFFFFGLNGLTDILCFYQFPLPADMDYVTAVLAFCMESLLFAYHIEKRSSLDVQIHTFLLYAAIACTLATAVEMRYKDEVLPALARAFTTLLQGTWFYHVGFILYPPNGDHWDVDSQLTRSMMTLFFTWHIATIFVFFLVVGGLIWLRVKYKNQEGKRYDSISMESSLLSGDIQHVLESENDEV